MSHGITPTSNREYFEDRLNPDNWFILNGKVTEVGYNGIGVKTVGKSTLEHAVEETEELSEAEQQRLQVISEQIAQGIVPATNEKDVRLLGLATTEEIKKRLSNDDLGKSGVDFSKDGEVLSINLYKESAYDKGKHYRYTYGVTASEITDDAKFKELIFKKCEERLLSGEVGWQYLSKNLAMLNSFGVIEKLAQSSEGKQAIVAGIVRDLGKAVPSLSQDGEDRIFLHYNEPGLKELLGSTEVRYSDEIRTAWRNYIVAMFKNDVANNTNEAFTSIEHQAAYFGLNSVAGDSEIRSAAKEYFKAVPKKGDYYSTPCKALLIEDLREESLKAA